MFGRICNGFIKWNKKTKYVGEGKDRHLQDYYEYKANNFEDAEKPYQPSIYMPKDAARIWLKVVNIKVNSAIEISRY